GSQLAFWEADTPLAVQSLCLIRVGEGQERCFPIGPRNPYSPPSWSPDGRRVAFAACTGVGIRDGFLGCDVCVFDFRNDSLTQLTHTQGDEVEADWSPDGTAIAVLVSQSGLVNQGPTQINNGPTELWLVNPETGQGQPLLANGHINFGLTWSPDG